MAIRTDFAAGEVLAAADLNDTFGAKLNLAGGKVLQVVRATDATNRATTSTSFVDASLSVTITPQKSTSAIILISTALANPASSQSLLTVITDNSNNELAGSTAIAGTTNATGQNFTILGIGYSTPGTTSATTYKLRFRVTGGTGTLVNSVILAQLYAIEVSA